MLRRVGNELVLSRSGVESYLTQRELMVGRQLSLNVYLALRVKAVLVNVRVW